MTSEVSDIVLDAVANIQQSTDMGPGHATGGMIVFGWVNGDGNEEISVATTDGLGTHVMLGMAEWIRSIVTAQMIDKTHTIHEEDDE